MASSPVIYWFRQDLRLYDNPALAAAVAAGDVIPVYILDDKNADSWRLGGASRWWLQRSLAALNASLGGQLHVFQGRAEEIVPALVQRLGASGVYWNRCYEPWRIKRDKQIKELLQETGIRVHSFNGSLLWEPWEILKGDGTPYKVFTPYFRTCLAAMTPSQSVAEPAEITYPKSSDLSGECSLDDLGLLPSHPWHQKLEEHWQPGETGAHKRLDDFLEHGLKGYAEGRDFPARDNISRLSPHLHFGELSPPSLWQRIRQVRDELPVDVDAFLRELVWRDFSYYQLYHFPRLPQAPLRSEFERFPFADDREGLQRWQRGLTGYPLVDAGLRELWQTGFMHNRVRMVTASFLVKNQLLSWQQGARWFWDCLVDADLASNSAGWQWVAGCGVDAAPYFRIFNPVTQGQKFDPDGDYIRRYLPELAQLSTRYIHSPWTAPPKILAEAGIRLGVDYPEPIVDVRESRQRALAAYQVVRQGGKSNGHDDG